MKIVLNNFRCYASKDIDTPSSGVVLLSGPSGKGKSTLLNAISYAITGDGKNISTFGTTKTSVSVDIDGIRITRTKRPNRLTLQYPDGTLLEDDEAQATINRMFGKFFNQSSYIMQGNLNTFLYMSPTEKLEFFEEFVFNHLDLSDKKDKVKALIKERNTNLVSYRSKLDMIEQILSSKSEPQKPVFPIKCQKEERPDVKAKYQRLQTNKKESILTLNIRLRKSLEITRRNQANLDTRTRLEMRKSQHEKELEDIIEKIVDVPEIDHTDTLKRLNDSIKRLQNAKDIYLSCGTEEDVSSLESKLEDIKLKMWTDESEEDTRNAIEENNQMYRELQSYYNAKAKLEELDSPYDLDAIRKEIQTAELCKKTLRCPCCKENLSFDGETLHKIMKTPTASISELKNKLKKAETTESLRDGYMRIIEETESTYEEIYSLEDTKNSIEEYKKYLNMNLELDSEYKSLQRKVRDVKESNKRIRERREGVSLVMKEFEVDIDTVDEKLDSMRRDTQAMTTEMSENIKTREAINELKNRKTEIENSLIVVNTRLESMHIEDAEDPEMLNESISKESKDLEKIESVLEKIDTFERLTKERTEYEKLIRDKSEYEKEVKKWDELLQSIYLLREKISIAESLYMEKTLHELNAKIQDNLNLFFVDEPMVVSLETFKPTKDKKESKPQINLQVFYKGVDMDLMSLSGGERDRVNLAIVLALNTIFDSPMLMLDECISSLDYNNFNRVIDSLQENLKDKLVLLVCHQAEEGQFDDVLAI